MFFLLSKVLTFLISPAVIILLLLLAALILKNRPAASRRILIASFALLLLFSNPFVINQLLGNWELKFPELKPGKRYDAAIILSGFMTINKQTKRISFGEGVDRMTDGLALYRGGYAHRIIISGGSGSMVNDLRESTLTKEFLVKNCGVPDSVILVDTISRNTYENAVETRKIMKDHGIKTTLLVTSAFHMRRAKACFDKLNIATDIYPTDILSSKQEYYPSDLIIPGTDNIEKWEILMHEIVGILMYKIKGYN
ncbi:MAG: YdcF family protein [Daejeonella sp.]